MSTQYAFGKIVTDGLVLSLDAADRNSYVGSGTVWSDLSGNNNSGSLTNGPIFSSANGGSIVFDGSNDYVKTSLNIDSNPNTICAWYNLASYNITGDLGRGIVLTDNGSWDKGFEVYFTGSILIHIGNNFITASNYNFIKTGSWYYGVVTYTNNSMKFYHNGYPLWITGSGPGSTVGSTVEIGRANYLNGNGSRFFTGSIPIVQIYNRELSSLEILQNYNAQKSRFGLI